MKKTLKTIIALVITASMLVGCAMRGHIGLNITSDGNVSLKMVMAMDDEMIDAMLTMKDDPSATESKTYTDEERWAYIESDDGDSSFGDIGEGFTKERYSKDNFKGIQASQNLGKLDDVSGENATSRVNIFDSAEGSDLSKQVLFIKDGDVYKSNMTIDLGEEAGEMNSYQQMGAAFELKFVLELPSKPISNNATQVSSDGKTLTWDLLTAKDIEVEFKLDGSGNAPSGAIDDDDDKNTTGGSDSKESKKADKDDDDDDEKSNLWLYVGIGAGALVLLIIIIVIIVSVSKKKKQNAQAAMVQSESVMAPNFEQPAEPPVQPIQPAQPVEVAQPQPEQPVDPNQPQQ